MVYLGMLLLLSVILVPLIVLAMPTVPLHKVRTNTKREGLLGADP